MATSTIYEIVLNAAQVDRTRPIAMTAEVTTDGVLRCNVPQLAETILAKPGDLIVFEVDFPSGVEHVPVRVRLRRETDRQISSFLVNVKAER